jgi:serine/threonine-protein kinase RIM15
MESMPNTLAPPAVTSLRAGAGAMERSLSEDIREEREELREAAEQTLNVIMDLKLDGTIRWVSPSWVDVIGTRLETVTGSAVSDLIVGDNTSVFTDIVESMKKDDSHSKFIRFAVTLGPLSKLLPLERIDEAEENPQPEIVDLEAQGIMVYDAASGGESHVGLGLPLISARGVDADTFPDHVDDSSVDRPARNQNRPSPFDCRLAGFRCRSAC